LRSTAPSCFPTWKPDLRGAASAPPIRARHRRVHLVPCDRVETRPRQQSAAETSSAGSSTNTKPQSAHDEFMHPIRGVRATLWKLRFVASTITAYDGQPASNSRNPWQSAPPDPWIASQTAINLTQLLTHRLGSTPSVVQNGSDTEADARIRTADPFITSRARVGNGGGGGALLRRLRRWYGVAIPPGSRAVLTKTHQ